MASRVTNDAKRDEMKRLMEAAQANGWTLAEIALVFGFTTSAVRSWAKGDSMGTNADRARLATLPSKANAAQVIKKSIGYDEESIARLTAQGSDNWITTHVAKLNKRIAALNQLLATVGAR